MKLATACVLCAATVSGTARAESDATASTGPVRVVYTADDDAPCPTSAEFGTAVRERLRRGQLATNAENGQDGADEYRVHVRRVGTRYVARLNFGGAKGAARTRELGAETCADAAKAIALVTALAIDAGGTDSDAVTPEADGPISASEALGLVTPVAPAPPVAPVATAPPEGTVLPSEAVPHAPRLSGEIGLRITMTSPKGPSLLPGAELFFGLSEPRVFHVELGVAAERGFSDQQGPGSARFSFVGGRLHGCALSLELGRTVDLMPCVILESGTTVAEGFIAHPQTQTNAWFAAGPAVRLAGHFRSGSIDVKASLLFPTTRNSFVFGPTEPVHDVPAVGIYAAAGGALRLF